MVQSGEKTASVGGRSPCNGCMLAEELKTDRNRYLHRYRCRSFLSYTNVRCGHVDRITITSKRNDDVPVGSSNVDRNVCLGETKA